MVCPGMVDACTRAAWHEGGLKGVPRLPLFLSKNQVPLGFNLDAKHPDSKLAILEDWVDNAQPTLATLFLPRSIALSAEGGTALGPRMLAFFQPTWHEERPERTTARTVISLLCRLAGGPQKLKEALRAGPAGIQRLRDLNSRAHRRRAMDSVVSLAGAMWLLD